MAPMPDLPPLRSVLFAPGNRPELAAKLPRSRPGAAILDLEDGVPGNAHTKEAARPLAREAAEGLRRDAPGQPVMLRVNPLHSPYFAGDLAALTPGLAGVVVPKLESAADVEEVAGALAGAGFGELPVMAGLETGLGVWNARDILSHPAVRWGYFGAEDYTTDLGGRRLSDNSEVLYARSRVALAARLAGAEALDIVVTRLGDEAAFRRDAEAGRALGYSGKMCIHPAQVPLAEELFGVSAAELERARALVAAYEAAAAQGQGVIAFEGQMVDEPMLKKARAVLAGGEKR